MKTTSNPLTGRGTAMMVAAPSLFVISEQIFHINPIVGGVIAGLAGMVAYRHWDDVDAGLEKLKEGTIKQYRTRDTGGEGRGESFSSAKVSNSHSKATVGNLIPIGKQQNGKMFERDLHTLRNMIILGLSGGGKTNTAIHVVKHAVRRGARIAVIDKHARAGDESLAVKVAPWENAFICPIGADPASSMNVINQVKSALDERLEEGAPAEFPLILVVDEYSAIMRQKEDGGKWGNVGEELSGLIEDILSGGRKAKIFCVCIGQISNVSRTGGSEIRELFSTRIAHAMSAKQAGLFGFGEQKNLLPGLGTGEVFIQSEGMMEPIQLMIRYESEQDIENEGAHIPAYEPLVFEERDTEELEELPDTKTILKSKKRFATLNDAIEVWNAHDGEIGSPRLRKELQLKGLDCSDYLAKQLLANIKERMEA